MIVDNVGVLAHRHDCCFNFYLLECFLFKNFHHSHCPRFIVICSTEDSVDCAHCSFPQQLDEHVFIIWTFMDKLYFGDLFVELCIGQQDIFRNNLLFLEPMKDLNHCLRIFLDLFSTDVTFFQYVHHFFCQPFDAEWTVHIDLQMQIVFKICRSVSPKLYLLM